MNSFTVSTFVESNIDDCYAVSKNGRYIAWVDSEEKYFSEKIYLEDLKTGISYEVTSEDGAYVYPIAFIGEDFVYGVANPTDVKIDALGDIVFPMSKIQILNTSEEKRDIIKTYLPQTGKIGTVTVDESNIYVELVMESGGIWVSCGQDTIMNRESEPANSVKLRKSVTDLKQTQVVINMKEIKKDSSVNVINPKHILLEEDREVNLDIETEGYFYVYARGKVLMATKDASAAVRCANENYGVVVDSNLKYIFKRARSTSQEAFANLSVNEGDANASSLVKSVSIMLTREGFGVSVSDLISTGQSPVEIMQNALKNATVLELRGCTIDDLLYFIDQGTPVLARTGTDKAILLTGYSSSYIYYYDPATKQSKSIDYNGVESLFAGGGNYFIAYVK